MNVLIVAYESQNIGIVVVGIYCPFDVYLFMVAVQEIIEAPKFIGAVRRGLVFVHVIQVSLTDLNYSDKIANIYVPLLCKVNQLIN